MWITFRWRILMLFLSRGFLTYVRNDKKKGFLAGLGKTNTCA